MVIKIDRIRRRKKRAASATTALCAKLCQMWVEKWAQHRHTHTQFSYLRHTSNTLQTHCVFVRNSKFSNWELWEFDLIKVNCVQIRNRFILGFVFFLRFNVSQFSIALKTHTNSFLNGKFQRNFREPHKKESEWKLNETNTRKPTITLWVF